MANVGPKMDWQTQQHGNNGGRRNNNNNNNNNNNINKIHNQHLAAGSSNNSAAMGNRSKVNDGIRAGNQGMLGAMLDKSPELIKSLDTDGLTPLSYAAYHGYVGMVDFLLRNYPSSRFECNEDKSYPIHKACERGHIEVLKKLYDSKSPRYFTWPDKYGQNILHIAAEEPKNKFKDVVTYLVNLDNQDIIKDLIAKTNENRQTPLQLAQHCKNYEVVAIIEQIKKYLD